MAFIGKCSEEVPSLASKFFLRLNSYVLMETNRRMISMMHMAAVMPVVMDRASIRL